MRTDVFMLGDRSESTRIVYNHLASKLGPFRAIVEERPSNASLLKNRIRRIGLLRVASQVLFIVLLRPFLKLESKRRLENLRQDSPSPEIPADCLIHVNNINCETTWDYLSKERPRVIVVNGTRILNGRTLTACLGIFINTHVGITPRYRGSHGGYWALYENNSRACGVTIHLVDKGVDTGNVIAQATIYPQPEDNFQTYPMLQLQAGLPLLYRAVVDALKGDLKTTAAEGPSKLWYGPGLFQYIAGRLRNVK